MPQSNKNLISIILFCSLPQLWSRLNQILTLLPLTRRLPRVAFWPWWLYLLFSKTLLPAERSLIRSGDTPCRSPMSWFQAPRMSWGGGGGGCGEWAYPLYKQGLSVNFRGFEQKGLSWPGPFLAVWSLSAPAPLSGKPSSRGRRWLQVVPRHGARTQWDRLRELCLMRRSMRREEQEDSIEHNEQQVFMLVLALNFIFLSCCCRCDRIWAKLEQCWPGTDST
jgi:hypothetical protein